MTAAAAPARRRPRTRRSLILPIHRWIGLTLGLVVLASGITGAGMAFRKQLDPIVYGDLLKAPACAQRRPLDDFVAEARALHPAGKLDYIRLLDRTDAPVILRFGDKATYYFEPCSGRLMGQQNRYEGVFGQLERIHRFVFVQNGGWLMGTGAFAAVLGLAALGLTVWWPAPPGRLRDALKLNTNLRGRAFELGLHRSLGAWVAIPLTISAATALPQAFDWVRNGVDALAGTPAEPAPQSTPPPGGAKTSRKIPMEQAWRTATALSPNPREILLHLPPKPKSAVEIYLIDAHAPHANARTYLYLDAYSGRVLRFTPYDRMGLGEKIYYWTLSIHTGEVGGLFGQTLLFFGALGVPVLAYTGIGAWLRRTSRRRRPPAPTRTGEPGPGSGRADGRRLARVTRIETLSPGVKGFWLEAADGRPLPPPEPGAHINVSPRSGLVRQYSLCNGPGETGAYHIAVRRDSASRGGSRAMHDHLSEGDLLSIGEPRNHFPLRREAASHLLLARGIGITPILAMAKTLAAEGADFHLDYFTRSADHTPFRALLSSPAFAGRVTLHHGLDEDCQRAVLDHLLSDPPEGRHVYACGGSGFMQAVEAATASWPAGTVHREYFTANPCAWAGERRAFEVHLARSGRTVHVPAEMSLAEALADAGIGIRTSCEQGVCGTCLTRVLDGAPDHRDAVLSPLERERGDCMALCVSRALGPELTLDL